MPPRRTFTSGAYMSANPGREQRHRDDVEDARRVDEERRQQERDRDEQQRQRDRAVRVEHARVAPLKTPTSTARAAPGMSSDGLRSAMPCRPFMSTGNVTT